MSVQLWCTNNTRGTCDGSSLFFGAVSRHDINQSDSEAGTVPTISEYSHFHWPADNESSVLVATTRVVHAWTSFRPHPVTHAYHARPRPYQRQGIDERVDCDSTDIDEATP